MLNEKTIAISLLLLVLGSSQFPFNRPFFNMNNMGGNYQPGNSYMSTTSSSYSSSSSSSFQSFDMMIRQADITGILKTIQGVVGGNMNCDAKNSQLQDLLGRIETGIKLLTQCITKTQEAIASASNDANKIRQQIRAETDNANSIGIPELKNQKSLKLEQLRLAYADYNTKKANIEKIKNTIAMQLQKIVKKQQVINQYNSAINHKDAQILKYDTQIQRVENIIKNLKTQKSKYENQKSSLQNKITTLKSQTTPIRSTISMNQNKIRDLQRQKQTSKGKYQTLEIQLQGIKSKMNNLQGRQNQLKQNIRGYENQLKTKQEQTRSSKVAQLTSKVQSLNDSLVKLKSTVDTAVMQCSGVANVQVEVQGSCQPCYNMDNNNFMSYMSTTYGFNQNAVQGIVGRGSMQLNPINIFSSRWAQNFGTAFSADIRSQGNNIASNGYKMQSDFSCSSSGVKSGYGKITGISADTIQIMNNNGISMQVKLGSCTRIQGLGSNFVPRAGVNVFWRAAQSGSSYRGLSLTCV